MASFDTWVQNEAFPTIQSRSFHRRVGGRQKQRLQRLRNGRGETGILSEEELEKAAAT